MYFVVSVVVVNILILSMIAIFIANTIVLDFNVECFFNNFDNLALEKKYTVRGSCMTDVRQLNKISKIFNRLAKLQHTFF